MPASKAHLLLIALRGISGDGYDFRSFLRLKLPYHLSCSDAVHFGHLDIHEDQVIRPQFEGLENFLSI
jgi:hypothetical protein